MGYIAHDCSFAWTVADLVNYSEQPFFEYGTRVQLWV